MYNNREMSKAEVPVKVSILEENASIDGLHTNFLKFKVSGKDVNFTIVSTLRRVIRTLIPVYAYDPEDMIIEKNTSIFNNDYMRLRLSNIPIINKSYTKPLVSNDESTIDKVLELEEMANIANFKTDFLTAKEKDDLKKKHQAEIVNNLHVQINGKNTTNRVMNVTSEDAYTKYFIKTESIPNIYPRRTLFIQLKPNEEFRAICKASLNIALKSSIYSCCAACSYEEINDNEYDFYLESLRQISEREIVKRACTIINIKLKKLQDKIIDAIQKSDMGEVVLYEAELVIDNENHTMGNIITRILQDHPNVTFCGYKIDHLCVNELTIRYKTKDVDIITILKEVTINLMNIFDKIKKNF